MMYKPLRIIVLIVVLPVLAYAYFPIGPDHTLDQPAYHLLANKFRIIKNVGSYILGVVDDGFLFYTISETDSVLVPVSKEYVTFTPISVRQIDNQLIFRSDSNVLYFYDISQMPQVTYQGKINLGIPFADYAIDGRYMYVSRWFDGISRYRINSFSKVQFVDSSLKGVLVTQLVRSDSCLYALDEYNGIMRYRSHSADFGEFIDYLYIPERPSTFILSDSGAIVQTLRPNVFHGYFKSVGADTSRVYDSTTVTTTSQQLIQQGRWLALADGRIVTIIDLYSPMQIDHQYLMDDLSPTGDIVYIGKDPYLLLPGKTSGATFFPITDDRDPFPALSRPGVITGIQLRRQTLLTAGAANPLDIYAIDSLGAPVFSHSIPKTPPNVRAFDESGDSLVVLYSPDSRIDLIIHPEAYDSTLQILTYPYGETDRSLDIKLYPHLRDSITAVVIQQANKLEMIPWPTGDSLLPKPQTWESAAQINRFFIHDSLLLIATTKHTILCYLINTQFETQFRGILNLTSNADEFFLLNDQNVLIFNDRVIARCNISNPLAPRIDTAIVLPLAITKVDEANNVLFGVGPNGVGIFSLKSSMPVLLDRGGKWGQDISVEGNAVATTDGSEIHLYYLRDYSNDSLPAPPPEPELPKTFLVRQNYPNPFNGVTHISYDVPVTGHVQMVVYNILGQQVVTLVDAVQEAGTHEAIWDGKTSDGTDVATGIYYYRLTASGTRITKKMLLIK